MRLSGKRVESGWVGCLVGLCDCQEKELRVDGLLGWFVRLSGKRFESGWVAWVVCDTVRKEFRVDG